jgi:hypothetical protein
MKVEPVKRLNSIEVGPKRDRKMVGEKARENKRTKMMYNRKNQDRKRKKGRMDQRELGSKNWKDKNAGKWLDSTLAV